MILLLTIKLLTVIAIYGKAYNDAKGNNTPFEHIITAFTEGALVIVAILFYYFEYPSLVFQSVLMYPIAYVLLRHAFFDIFWNDMRGVKRTYVGNNNYFSAPKKWFAKIEEEKKIPLLTISRFIAFMFGLIL